MDKRRAIQIMTKAAELYRDNLTDTTGSGHGALAGFLSGMGVDTLICGGDKR